MKTGGPAFPNVPDGAGDRWNDWDMGMTLRDYFAAKALQGWLSSFGEDDRHPAMNCSADEVARASYEMADAMLRAREGE